MDLTNRRTTRRTMRTAVIAVTAGALVAAGVQFAAAGPASLPPVVDTVILYTPKAQQDAGGEDALRGIAERAARYTNQAFVNSQANVRARVVAVLPAPDYNPDGKDESTAAYDYLANTPPSAERLRDTVRADVVALFASDVGGFSAGDHMMLLGHDRTNAEPDYFAHELGHLLGLAHDGERGKHPYSRGYVAPSMKWRDIMAYEDVCKDAGKTCPVIPYYSNPRLTYEGEPLGVPIGQPGEADATATLNETGPIVAAYR